MSDKKISNKELMKVMEEIAGLIHMQTSMVRGVLQLFLNQKDEGEEETETPKQKTSRFFYEKELDLINCINSQEN